MKAPRDHWIIQIEVTNACIHKCSNCTRFCGLHKTPFFMSYETFCEAVDSIIDHPGLIGVMGGEPTLHPQFTELCRYLQKKLPTDRLGKPENFILPTDSFIEVRRRSELGEYVFHDYGDGPRPVIFGAGLWTTVTPNYMKNFEIIQDVFKYQLLNDHSNASYHQPILISRKDMGIDDKKWIRLREKCWINQQWSSSITPKGCFFCEIAAALDMLYDGPGGLPIEKDWWKRDIDDFKDQFRWCELCGIPLKTFARDAREGIVDVSEENAILLQEKATAKYIPDRLNLVEISDGKISEESKKATTEYLGSSYIKNAQERISVRTPIFAKKFIGIMLCDSEAEITSCEDKIKKNMKYVEQLYIIVDGMIKKIISTTGKNDCSVYHSQLTVQEFLEYLEEGIYLIFFTGEIILGDGFRKLKECVINPGTLHAIYFSRIQKNIENPYIETNGKQNSGICALLNNRAISLKKMKLNVKLNRVWLEGLWNEWPPEKRVELSVAMNSALLGVGDSKNRKTTRYRRLKDGKYFLEKCVRENGLLKTGYYGLFFVRKYGLKLLAEKMRRRIF